MNYAPFEHEAERWGTATAAAFHDRIIDDLVAAWRADYFSTADGRPDATLICGDHGYHYLFDPVEERLVSAWGITRAYSGKRESARQSQIPRAMPVTTHVHGHSIAHSLGGGLDINIVPQNRAINNGAFRSLEIRASAMPDALYFVAWKYGSWTSPHALSARRWSDMKGAVPVSVEQGLFQPGLLTLHTFMN